MSDDLSEFHGIFFEEADELVESMEAELLEMLGDPDDPERINTVFRAAHSIKGGSATFGFDPIAKFTHVMETLMDEVRDGARRAEPDLIDLLLKATDCVRTMLETAKAEQPLDLAAHADVMDALNRALGASAHEPDATAEQEAAEQKAAGPASERELTVFEVQFRPGRDVIRTANEPLAFLKALAALGEMRLRIDTSEVPRLADLQPTDCYLAWHLALQSDVDEAEVAQIFDWIDVASRIEITRHVGSQAEKVWSSFAADAPESVAQAVTAAEQAQDTAPSAAAVEPPGKPNTEKPAKTATSIRVGIDKIDKLINLVGELVITQSMLNEEGNKLPPDLAENLQVGLSQLQRYTLELQESVMQIRMVPISNAFNRLPRMIHDLSNKLGKHVELHVSGEQTELDKTVLESIGDPLVHLVRNAVDHGIEMPATRESAGKDANGHLHLSAYHESGNIVIEIKDDGAGVDTDKVLNKAKEKGLVPADATPPDAEIWDLLFHPGFSTADEVSDVSGRGVGMDVVRRNIQSLGGNVEIYSTRGQGSVFTIRLPLTLAIIEGQLIGVAKQTFVLPLTSIVESTQLEQGEVRAVADRGVLYKLRDEYIPLIQLSSVFALSQATDEESLVVVVETGQGKLGLLVDDLLAQQQVVIKSLEANFHHVPGIAGATILGDGAVALILDIDGVNKFAKTVAKPLRLAAA